MLNWNSCLSVVAVCVVLVLATGCASAPSHAVQTSSASFCNITSSPGQFNGATVSVIGSVSAGPEGSVVIVSDSCKRGMYLSTQHALDSFAAFRLNELIFPPEFPEVRPTIKVRASGSVKYFPKINRIWLIVNKLEILD